MASKFTVKAAFKAHLLLRRSLQRTVFHQPTLPLILTSRQYSDSPKSSGSTEGSQSSGPAGKTWINGQMVAFSVSVAVVRAGSFLCAHLKHADYQRLSPHIPPMI